MSTGIDYGHLMHAALRRLMADVLTDVGQNGLPGEHHFFISFDTHHPGLDVPEWLLSQYPESMTIVIQNWFENLEVSETAFDITLSFSNQPVRLHVPFDAVQTFFDPSVEFGLQFDAPVAQSDDGEDAEAEEAVEAEVTSLHGDKEAEVVSLDTFRK